MAIQFSKLKGTNLYDSLLEGYAEGFKVYRNLVDIDITAMDVAEQYFHAKKQDVLIKEDKANYNNRWFQPNFKNGTKRIQRIHDYIQKQYKTEQCMYVSTYVCMHVCM